MEQCKNPQKLECHNKDIIVYLQINQEKTPICQQCWFELADANIEWDENGLRVAENNNNLHPVENNLKKGIKNKFSKRTLVMGLDHCSLPIYK